ncbi:MAG: site-specific integrase [Anaerolineales bacterium]|nr:site-specific integrase [Anaerolineales bacterium]MCB9129081.1 site-specific integrase [Ardenticatenales bacterium]MCB9172767.1 site-specific integrase [Ardenticatenales bacterium]
MSAIRHDPTQPALFEIEADGSLGPPVTVRQPLSGGSSLAAAIGAWQDSLKRRQLSENTIKSFRSDMNLLARYYGRATPLHKLDTQALQTFLRYLLEGRDAPCSPKSYQRRVTTLKSFFKWLHENDILPSDPAATLIHPTIRVPLPEILFDKDIEALRDAATAIRHDEESPDVRPHLLLSLLLKTGMKKSEVMQLAPDHLDFNDPSGPVLYVRYANPRYALKERKLALPEDFESAYRDYVAQYEPKETLFDCTARNLEYVLTALAEAAGVKAISFEMLRMTSAVHDHRDGMDEDHLRQKMGLSEITWRNTGPRIAKLAEPGL